MITHWMHLILMTLHFRCTLHVSRYRLCRNYRLDLPIHSDAINKYTRLIVLWVITYWMHLIINDTAFCLIPPVYVVCWKVMFLVMSVCLFIGEFLCDRSHGNPLHRQCPTWTLGTPPTTWIPSHLFQYKSICIAHKSIVSGRLAFN